MLDKLDWVRPRFEEVGMLLSDPEVVKDQKRWQALVKEHARLEPLDAAIHRLGEMEEERQEAGKLLTEPGMEEMAQEELSRLNAEIEETEQSIRIMLIPPDPNAERSAVMEIRSGAGGEEAALFAAELQRMYMRYAERRGWTCEMIDVSPTEQGGIKEAVFEIHGDGVFSRLRYESGVHRVQRVPVTESNGKRQTSTATVAVMPEAQDVDVEIDPNDLRIDTYRASGHGGQYINRTDSAVRITHLPTGVVVTCQDEKSQLKNKEKAMRVLRTRLYERALEARHEAEAEDRRSQVGTGDRSERIRTYNFYEGRVTDHRIGKTVYSLPTFLDGDIDELVEPLILADRQEKLRQLGLASNQTETN